MIDLSLLPAPDVIETIDFETLLAERKARLVSFYPADQQQQVTATLDLESEPLTRALQENAYREMLLRQYVIDSARALMLAFAERGNLEHLAALFGIKRHTINEPDPENGIDGVYEGDTDLRYRTQLAPQGFSVAGPEAAYRSKALNADGRVRDVWVESPAGAEIVVTVLSRDGDGTADKPLLDRVTEALSPEDVRPIGDRVDARSAIIKRYTVTATLIFYDGPDREVALSEAKKRVGKFTTGMHKLGEEVTRDGISAALRVSGVQKVILLEPATDIPVSTHEAAFCTEIEVLDGGIYRND
ncbi:baseplate J/gp47 family protein [Burkholderia sp. SCN-KJ]|nr:baseplate J/gp47 family protein [Burkholderia sp. SCN-KJ]MCR4465849.1 baseplate J/gp47 family protein [Burkholderia sp. SCN-KJ]